MPLLDVFLVILSSAATLIVSQFLSRLWKRAPEIKRNEDTWLEFNAHALTEASAQGRELMNQCVEAGFPLSQNSDWKSLAKILHPRFPGIPIVPPNDTSVLPMCFDSSDKRELSQVTVEEKNGLLRVTLIETQNTPTASAAKLHEERIWSAKTHSLQSAVQSAPYPMWQQDAAGQIIWSNSAYDLLALACFGPNSEGHPNVFRQAAPVENGDRYRAAVALYESEEELWFDVTSVQSGSTTMNYASEINVEVEAEIQQKDFVQTLTKTLAELSTGLAVFDQRRRLVLFNPALQDLTGLSARFLCSQPHLNEVFDRLRDAQMIPEPKDYKSWRDAKSAIAEAADEGRYVETWNLVGGITYQISGRPHPNGGLAFLIEDKSAETKLTRQLKADLQIKQSVLNQIEQPIAVLSPSGALSFANKAFRKRWGLQANTGLIGTELSDLLPVWQHTFQPSAFWHHFQSFAVQSVTHAKMRDVLHLLSGKPVIINAQRLNGGTLLVTFEDVENSTLPEPLSHVG